MSNTISLCVIAKNASQEFQNLLDSAMPYVQELVVVLGGKSKDNTEEIARKHTDKVYPFVWTNSFSDARNESFKYATSDWLLWLDTDDVLINGELLQGLIDGVPPDIDMIDLPYLYARDEYGNLTTTFTRERLIRRSSNPTWIGRVHEVVFSQGLSRRARNTDVLVNHNPISSKPDPIERNLKLLQLQWRDYTQKVPNAVSPNRTASLLGFQYFAKRDLPKAIYWFNEYLKYEALQEHKWNESVWQATCYIAICYRLLGEFQVAMEWDLRAISMIPEWADPYIGMVEDCNGLSKWSESLSWHKIAQTKQQADPQVFVNPMQYTFNLPLSSIEPLIRTGNPEDALEVIDHCLTMQPKNQILLAQKDALVNNLIPANTMAQAVLSFAQHVDQKYYTDIFKMAPDLPKQFPVLTEKLIGPTYLKRSLYNRIVIFCGNTCPEPFGPDKLSTGIGGSETAVIRVSQELEKLGYHIDVYNVPGPYAGTYGDVGYYPYEWYRPDEPALLFVSWRNPSISQIVPGGERKWLWLHDLHYGPNFTEQMARYYHRIMGVSQWHNDYLKDQYMFLRSHPGILHTTNGIDKERFSNSEVRVTNRIIYSSSPDRGLEALLGYLPYIRAVVKNLTLDLFYGFQYCSPAIIKHFDDLLNHYGNNLGIPITAHGRVGQDQLSREFLKSDYWIYPSDFAEVSCITAMEAMCAGCITLTSNLGALPETVSDGGITIPMPPNSELGMKMFVGTAVNLMTNEDLKNNMRTKALNHKSPSWSDVALEWHNRLQEELSD